MEPLPFELDKRRKLSDDEIERMCAMHRLGYGYRRLSKEFGVTQSTAAYWVNPEFRKLKRELSKQESIERYHFQPGYREKKHLPAMRKTRKLHQNRYNKAAEEWRKANPEKQNEMQKAWRDANKGKIRELNEKYWKEHRQRKYLGKQLWTWKTKLEKADNKERREMCLLKIKEYSKLFENEIRKDSPGHPKE
ncbi:MAG: hypothetical protein ABIJ34_04205 [archaeon]